MGFRLLRTHAIELARLLVALLCTGVAVAALAILVPA